MLNNNGNQVLHITVLGQRRLLHVCEYLVSFTLSNGHPIQQWVREEDMDKIYAQAGLKRKRVAQKKQKNGKRLLFL
jgi:hypothetical protein